MMPSGSTTTDHKDVIDVLKVAMRGKSLRKLSKEVGEDCGSSRHSVLVDELVRLDIEPFRNYYERDSETKGGSNNLIHRVVLRQHVSFFSMLKP
jgi:hypothetical protein